MVSPRDDCLKKKPARGIYFLPGWQHILAIKTFLMNWTKCGGRTIGKHLLQTSDA